MASQQLNCEDEEQRLARMNVLLARLNAIPSRAQAQTSFEDLLSNPDPATQSPDTHTDQLLNRVRAFLPELLAANEDVQQRARENPSAVDIESFDGTEEAYIQLNLGLGLFERVHAQPSSSRNDNDEEEEESSSESSTDTSTNQSNVSDHDSSEDEGSVPDLISLVTGTRPMRPLLKSRRKRHPGIVVLGSSDSVQEPGDQPEEMQDETVR